MLRTIQFGISVKRRDMKKEELDEFTIQGNFDVILKIIY